MVAPLSAQLCVSPSDDPSYSTIVTLFEMLMIAYSSVGVSSAA